MAISRTRFSWGWWGKGKDKEPVINGASLNSSSEWGLGYKETSNLKFSTANKPKIAPSFEKARRKWRSREERREERRIDKEYDMVLVPSDGFCFSESESDGSDWSIGWLEPHSSEFQWQDENDGGFAVLVPCYNDSHKKLVPDSDNQLLNALQNFQNEFSSGKNHMLSLEEYVGSEF